MTTEQFFIIIMFFTWLFITILNYIDINKPEQKRNKVLGYIHVLFSAPLIFYFAGESFIDGLIYGYFFTFGFIITTVYIVAVQSTGD